MKLLYNKIHKFYGGAFMAFLSSKRKAVFLAYPKNGDDTGVMLPIMEDSSERLVAQIQVLPENKTAELALYPDQISGFIKLKFAFDEHQDFLCAVVRVRPLADIEEKERPLVDIPIMYDPDDNNSESIEINLPNEPVVIFVMFPEQMNMGYGSNTITITTVD